MSPATAWGPPCTLHADPATDKLLQAVGTMKGKILLTGVPQWWQSDSSAVACFTGNYSYINASYFCAYIICADAGPEAYWRQTEVNDFYQGKTKDPLTFLRDHKISAVLIFPTDQISDDIVSGLKQKLGPSYEYQDFHEPGKPNTGIFISHSLPNASAQ